MGPEDEARELIDAKLTAAGWVVQDKDKIDLSAGRGIAVREFSLKPHHGTADYLLYVDRKAIGIIEAKAVGIPLKGVEEQSARYSAGLPDDLPAHKRPLPFLYESTGEIIQFTNQLDPIPRSRDIFHFHKPETLLELVRRDVQPRGALQDMPLLLVGSLWRAQVEAIQRLERSLADNRPRSLIQMATGSGKTYAAANFIYRLIKHAEAKRVLFLADRRNLVDQAHDEIASFHPPGENHRLGQLYTVQKLRSNLIDPASRAVITTVQRLYSILKGEAEFDPGNEEGSMFDSMRPLNKEPLPVEYNPELPIESFDFIIVDECHRSIYNLWRQVLEYFDAFIIGLTATPSKQTIGYFHRNLVMEYGHDEAVADGVNVDFDVYRILTRITASGSSVDAGNYVGKRDRMTRKVMYEKLDEDLTYTANQLDRDVIAEDQIRTVIRTFKDKLFKDIFPGREEVPKTLIFAKDDSHADDIVGIIRQEFGKGNDFCQKITYRTGFMKKLKKVLGEDGIEREDLAWERVSNLTPKDILTNLRNLYNPRIAVSVDMVATGTDVKPLEIVMFMRNVQSALYFDQMKGRGVRVINRDDLMAVTPDARGGKSHFVIIDCVGLTEGDITECQSLNREPTADFKKLLNYVAQGGLNPDTLETLAGRLSRLDRMLTDSQRKEVEEIAGGKSVGSIAHEIVKAVQPDTQERAARGKFELEDYEEATKKQLGEAYIELAGKAVEPLLKPDLRNRLLEIKAQKDQIIDQVSLDEVLIAGHDQKARERATMQVGKFREWIEENKDEILAIQLLYSERYSNRLKFKDIKEIAQRIQRPPLNTSGEELWRAFETLERTRVRGSGGKQLVDLVSLIRQAINPDGILVPFANNVWERYQGWLEEQANSGAFFSEEQRLWLDKIVEHIATSISIEMDDFDYGWFGQNGSRG
ncbi:MAG TPA: DEAD/DEAH box helicase family protein, partial [Anaerolineales bacterium]|nr:DEAD/DEAH box helicase family protein [Anaerolineales bacterium]